MNQAKQIRISCNERIRDFYDENEDAGIFAYKHNADENKRKFDSAGFRLESYFVKPDKGMNLDAVYLTTTRLKI